MAHALIFLFIEFLTQQCVSSQKITIKQLITLVQLNPTNDSVIQFFTLTMSNVIFTPISRLQKILDVIHLCGVAVHTKRTSPVVTGLMIMYT